MSRRSAGEGSIYRRADGYWAASVDLPRTGGKRRRKVVSGRDKGTVIRKLREVKRQLERAGDLPTASMTVEQWVDYWMREVAVRSRRPKTVASYRSIMKHVTGTIGRTRLDKLTPATVRRVLTVMESDGLSSTYRRNAHSVMGAVFKDAEREGRIPRNPVELVEAPRKAVPQLDALTADEAIALLDVFKDSPEGVLWATFILTGARRGEVLGLEWDRVSDVLDFSWQLQRLSDGHRPDGFEARGVGGGLYLTRPKTRAGTRVVPLVDPLLSILERAAPSPRTGLVFTDTAGRPFDPDRVTKQWPAVLHAAGINKRVTVHGLRHTTVDLLLEAGVSEEVVSSIVGHSSQAVTRSYRSKRNDARVKAAMVSLSRSLGAS